MYQRTANWCTPLNNAPITPEEQAQLRADFEAMRETLNTSVSGFLHPAHDRATFDDSKEERRAFFEKMWNSPGFSKLTSHYTDLLFDPAANAEWCEFIAEKIRSIVDDPETAEKLIPKDHRFGEKRPPFVTGYYETYNHPNVSLVDLEADADRAHDRARDRDGRRRAGVRHRRVGDRLRLRHRRAARAWGSAAATVSRSTDALGRRPEDVPRRPDRGLPELLLPRRAARRGRQQPAVQRRPGRLRHRHARVRCATTATTRSRSTAAAEDEWTDMVDKGAALAPFGESSYFFGTNIPGKPRRTSLNSGGRPKLFEEIAEGARERLQGVQTVAIGRERRAHHAGQPQRRRGEQEAAPVVLAQPRRELVQVPHLARAERRA